MGTRRLRAGFLRALRFRADRVPVHGRVQSRRRVGDPVERSRLWNRWAGEGARSFGKGRGCAIAPHVARAAGVEDFQHCAGRVSTDEALTADSAIQSRVAHNTLLNVLGLAVPLALAFFVMPVAARHLGPARFGLIGLAWAVTEYLVLFDLGLGRATVRFIADTLHRNPDDLAEIASLAPGIHLLAGIIGGAAFAFFAPGLVQAAFHLPPTISAEAVAMFRVVGFSLPAVLLLSGCLLYTSPRPRD